VTGPAETTTQKQKPKQNRAVQVCFGQARSLRNRTERPKARAERATEMLM
jgi:hypothetical protein